MVTQNVSTQLNYCSMKYRTVFSFDPNPWTQNITNQQVRSTLDQLAEAGLRSRVQKHVCESI